MLSHLRSDTRLFLIKIRTRAMQSGLEPAIKNIEKFLIKQKNLPLIDRAGIDLLQAELYWLNEESSEALDIFETMLMPVLKNLPDEVQVVILQNKNTVSFNIPKADAVSDFYYLYDYSKLSGVDPLTSKNLLAAHGAVEKGEHYDALPRYWQHVLYTFNQGIWNAHAAACAIMSKECAVLNWLPKAAYYAILSQDSKMADMVCGHLVRSQDRRVIEQTLDVVLKRAMLLKHASVACKIIEGIHDEIPDAYIEVTVNYLLEICSNKRQGLFEMHSIVNAWKAIRMLAHRLSCQKACEMLDAVINDEWFNSITVNRRHLIDTLSNLTAVLPLNKLMNLSKKALPLVGEKKSDVDYTNAVNLLCHIAFKDGGEVKKYLSKELYSQNENVSSALGQVAKCFDAKIKISDQEEGVKKVSQNVLLQVQRLRAEEEPQKVFDTFGNISKVNNDTKEKIVVQMAADSWLRMLTINKQLLKAPQRDMLISAMVAMIGDSDNLLSNKMGLINTIIALADILTKKQKQEIFKVLKPLASGLVTEGSVGMSHEAATNPLNPYKMKDTKPEAISGAALYALGCLEKGHPGVYGDELNGLIEISLTDKSPIIRANACMTTMEISKLSSKLVMDVLFGTRDPDYKTAIEACKVILGRKDIRLTQILWHRLFLALYEAARSENKELRHMVASHSKNLFSKAPLEYKSKINELTEMLKCDICYSVRSVLV